VINDGSLRRHGIARGHGVRGGGWTVVGTQSSCQQFRDFLYAPPMRVRVIDDGGHWHLPFVLRLGLASRVPRTFEPERSERLPLRWFVDGHVVSLDPVLGQPLLFLGSDALGCDVLARLLAGGRTTLAVVGGAAPGALVLGVVVGGVVGYVGGFTDEALMRVADLVLTLPMMYVVLALRAVLSRRTVFSLEG